MRHWLTAAHPSMKCYRKNGSDTEFLGALLGHVQALNEVLPKER